MSEDIRSLMEEGPEGTSTSPEGELAAEESGYSLVDPTRLSTDAGMTAHRGILHADEYVDFHALRGLVEAELGFSYADVSAVYARGGHRTAEQRQQRVEIDARLLALSRAGGNMEQFAHAVGISEKTVDRALARAREIDVQPMVATGVVPTRRVCFKTGEPPAKPRKRRFSTSPPQWVGTVDLSDAEYRKGFETRPGNPAYWAFREAV